MEVTELQALSNPADLISARELKIVLKLGAMQARAVKSKHEGGYRYYEVADSMLSEWELSENHDRLAAKGYVTQHSKLKFHNDKKTETIYLISLTKSGLILYFHCKLATKAGFDSVDLELLDQLFNENVVFLQNFEARVLLKYVDFVDLGDKTGYNISQFGRSVLEADERDTAVSKIEGLKDAIDKSPRQNMSNSNMELLYTLVRQLEFELSQPKPRKNVFLAKAHIIFQVIQVIGVGAAVVASVVTILQYFGV